MRSTNAVMPVHAFLLLLLPFAVAVSGPSVQPSNDTIPTPTTSPLILTYNTTSGVMATVTVAPLTVEMGLGQSQTLLNTIKLSYNITINDGHSQGSNRDKIVYVSCDPNISTSNLGPIDLINQMIAVHNEEKPRAVLLYSFTAPHCSLTNSFNYTSILTMTSIDDSQALSSSIASSSNLLAVTIIDQAAASLNAIPNNGTSGSSSQSGQTSAPTTAVAMSILYSITGIITLLFLIIIATGAIRAHRHPERYGPRGGLAGRPRQSRAKGLARAMLETLPIVQFGDPDPVKPGTESIRMEEGVNDVHPTPEVVTTPTPNADGGSQPKLSDVDAVPDSEIGPNIQTAEGSHTGGTLGESELGCSICTEDFEKGEDVRVLPCNHKFHPTCVDPWLLNVSGTCPLCRVDLRPAETKNSTSEPSSAEEADMPPPLAVDEGADVLVSHPRGRVARRLDARVLRNAPAHVRIAALRALRDQDVEAGSGPEVTREEQSHRTRLTGKLRDVFRIRTRPGVGTAPGATSGAEVGGVTEPSTRTEGRATSGPPAPPAESAAVATPAARSPPEEPL